MSRLFARNPLGRRFLDRFTRVDAKRLGQLAAWVFRDAMLRHRKPLMTTLATDGVHRITQLLAFAAVLGYANALEKNRTIAILGSDQPVRDSLPLLVIVACATFLLFSISAVAKYYSAVDALDLRRRYEEFCNQRILVLASRLPHPNSPVASKMLFEERILKRGPQLAKACGHLIAISARAIISAIVLILAVLVLVFVNQGFTAILLLLCVITLLPLLNYARETANTVESSRANAPAVASERKQLTRRVLSWPTQLDYSDPIITEAYNAGEISKDMDAFYISRFLMGEKVRLVVNLLTAAAFLSIILIAGVGIASEHWNWSVLVIYVVAMRYFLVAAGQVAGAMADAARHYPSIRDYRRFVADAEHADVSHGSVRPRSPIRLQLPSLAGEGEIVQLPVAQWTYLVNGGPPNRALAAELEASMPTSRAAKGPLFWFFGNALRDRCTWRESLGIPPEVTDAQFMADLKRVIPTTCTFEAPRFRLDEQLEDRDVGSLPQPYLKALKLVSALRSGRPAVLMNARDLMKRSDCLASGSVPAYFADLVVVLVSSEQLPPEEAADDAIVLVNDGQRTVAWTRVGLIRKNPSVVDEICSSALRASRITGEADAEDDDE